MLMVAFDDDGKYITNAFILYKAGQSMESQIVLGNVVSLKGKHSPMFMPEIKELLQNQQKLGFRIINRSGQCLSFLGDNT